MTPTDIFSTLVTHSNSPAPSARGDSSFEVITRAYYDTPAIIPGTTVGAHAVNDIVNRLLALGTAPRCLSATFAVSRHMPCSKQRYIAASAAEAATAAGIRFNSIDTVEARTDLPYGIAVTMTGIGETLPEHTFGTNPVCSGDIIILTGRAGAHGAAMYEAAHRSLFMPPVLSDSAALCDIIHPLHNAVGSGIRTMHYPAHGIMQAIAEIEKHTSKKLILDRDAVPVSPVVAAAAHTMRTSPLRLATAAAMIVIVHPDSAHQALSATRRCPLGAHAAIIGRIA